MSPQPALVLIHGGEATAPVTSIDIINAPESTTSIVVYKRTYRARDMAAYVRMKPDDLFIACTFIDCTGLESIQLFDCKVL